MFCYQCEQTAAGTGCDTTGACGKRPDIAALQELLFDVAKAVARSGADADAFLEDALFTTVTNVNFDTDRIAGLIRQGASLLAEADAVAPVAPTATIEEMLAAAAGVSLEGRIAALGADIAGLQELLAYGLKGMAAYGRHAR